MTPAQHGALRRLADSRRGVGLVVRPNAPTPPAPLDTALLILDATATALERRNLVTLHRRGRYTLAAITPEGRVVADAPDPHRPNRRIGATP